MANLFSVALGVLLLSDGINGFSPVPHIGGLHHVGNAATRGNVHRKHRSELPHTSLFMSSEEQSLSNEDEEDIVRQWDLFKKYHAKGQWRGTWTSYDYIGDEIDSTLAR